MRDRCEQSAHMCSVSTEEMFHLWNASGTHSRAFVKAEASEHLCSVECRSDQHVDDGFCPATEHDTTEDAFSSPSSPTFHADVRRQSTMDD